MHAASSNPRSSSEGGSKIAEHGGDNPGDRDVPLIVYAPGTVQAGSSDRWVETTQVAPTILGLLGLDPDALKAVRIEGTRVPPGIDQDRRVETRDTDPS